MKIPINHIEEFFCLYRKINGKVDAIYESSFNTLLDNKSILNNLVNKIPYKSSRYSLRNFLNQHKSIHFENIAELIFWFILPQKKIGEDIIDHSIEDFQKCLALLDKSFLKTQEKYRTGFNELLSKLVKNEHPFGEIEFDENWNLIGNKCIPQSKINEYLFELEIINTVKEKPKKNIKEGIIIIDILIILLFSVAWVINFNKNHYSSEPITENEICKPIDKKTINIIIFPKKELESSNNLGYARKLYNRIKQINQKDSLGLNIIFCDVLKDYASAYPNNKKNDSVLKQYRSNRSHSVRVEYLDKDIASFPTALSAKSFEEFRTRTIKSRNRVVVRKKFDDRELTYNAYYQIVRALHSYATFDKKMNDKIVNYIDSILFGNNPTIEDAELFNIKARLSLFSKDQKQYFRDLLKSYEVDNKNLSAIENIGDYYFEKNDSTAIKYSYKYFKIEPSHCSNRIKLAKHYAVFRKDFIKAKKILDSVGYKINSCESHHNYWSSIASLLILEKKYDQAILFLERKKLSFGENDSYYLLKFLAYAYYLNDETEKAITIFEDLKQTNINSPFIQQPLSFIYYKKYGVDKALSLFDFDKSGNKEISSIISHLYLEKGDLKNALKYINRTIGFFNSKIADPNHIHYLNQRRVINNRLKKYHDAKIDSVTIVDQYDPKYFTEKKYLTKHPDLHFAKIFKHLFIEKGSTKMIVK